MRNKTGILAGLTLAWFAAAAPAQAPLSAIDWLSDSIAAGPDLAAQTLPREEPAGGIRHEPITVTPLDAPSSDAVGLLPVTVTGLPKSLWGPSSSTELAGLIAGIDGNLLPAMQDLLLTLLLAELDPPSDSDPSARLFLARIDALLALGAVEQAQALLDRAGPRSVPEFRRWFDASLLTGTEDAACARLRGNPDLSPTLPARIFCLARGGDWDAAALTLETGRALGEMTAFEDALLTRFLDAETFEGAPPLPVPSRPSPLEFRLYEAIGEALPTTTLPLAFSYADLGPNSGWKAQIEAAERLARSGALSENLLLGLYTERRPAASGGVWDRVRAVQRLDAALAGRDSGAVAATLPEVWSALSEKSLELKFAQLYGDRLRAVPLPQAVSDLAFRIGLLSNDYEAIAAEREARDDAERFLIGLARGDLSGRAAPDALAQAISDGFAAATPAEPLAGTLARGELGAAILRAIDMASQASRGDLDKLADALALFRAVGLEDVARRTGLQLMILGAHG